LVADVLAIASGSAKAMTTAAERAARAQIAREHPFVPCEMCNDDGWRVDEFGGVYRCDCWDIHQAKVQALVDAAKERG
jgi:hypothetical protein